MLRRGAPVLLFLLAAALLVSYALYTRSVSAELRLLSTRSSAMFARIYAAFSDTTPEAPSTALVDLLWQIRDMKVPVILTDSMGRPTGCMNLPFCEPLDTARALRTAARFDEAVAPVKFVGGAVAHYGDPKLVRWLRMAPLVQGAVLSLLVGAGFVLLRERVRSQRERLWAGMARESAHQIATPLSSLNGWLELLADRDSDETTQRALAHMRADAERLERVAHRFERIGRPARRERVDVAAVALAVTDYFRARVPSLAHRVEISCIVPGSPAIVLGDPVLLEWALEAVIKNAIDAVAGREGKIVVTVDNVPEDGVKVRVADNGPGVNREIRSLIFQAGFSTKERGWGVGLALTRRIVEENHGGQLVLVPSERGAIFDIHLR